MNLFIVCKRAAWTSLCGVNLLWNVTAAEIGSKDFKATHLFQTTNLWTVHLQFTPEQWQAIEPAGGRGGFGGMFGGGGFGGRGGRGGPGGMNAGAFLAPAFMKAGDQDQDSKLSKTEFLALGEKWFADWDTNKTGKLNASQVSTGLGAVLGQGNAGFPGMGGMGGQADADFRKEPGAGVAESTLWGSNSSTFTPTWNSRASISKTSPSATRATALI
jgi:hypothetical protein